MIKSYDEYKPKAKKQEKEIVKYGGYRLKSSLQDIFTSEKEMNKLRTKLYRVQTNAQRQWQYNVNKAREAGIQENLINELYPRPKFYDIKTISKKSQVDKALNDLKATKYTIKTTSNKLKTDIKIVEGFKKDRKEAFETRNKIIEKVLDDMSTNERLASNPKPLEYDLNVETAKLTGNPKRYYYKKDYIKERRKLHRINYNPLYKTVIYKDNAMDNLEYAIINAAAEGYEESYIRKIEEVRDLFGSMTHEEVDVFAKLNSYDLATLIQSSDPRVIIDNYKKFKSTILRVKKASEEVKKHNA